MGAKIDLEDTGKLLLRVTLGATLLLHGINKLAHGIAGIQSNLAGRGIPEFFGYGVYVGEVVAPVMMIAGFKTRIAAAVFAFNMVVATLLAHSGDILALGGSGGWKVELQMLYLFGAVAVALLGAGRYSVSRGNGRWD